MFFIILFMLIYLKFSNENNTPMTILDFGVK